MNTVWSSPLIARLRKEVMLFFLLLLVGTGSGCVLYQLATGEIVGKVEKLFSASIFCVNPTDRNLIAAGTRGNTIYLVDLTSGQKQTLKTRAGQIRAMAFHPDGVHLAISLTRGGLQLWNTHRGELDHFTHKRFSFYNLGCVS